jgi:hypothetical protein
MIELLEILEAEEIQKSVRDSAFQQISYILKQISMVFNQKEKELSQHIF